MSTTDMDSRLDRIEGVLVILQNNQAEDRKLLTEHDKILVRGNGVPSLQETVRNLSTGLTEFVVEYKREREEVTKRKQDELQKEKEERLWWKRTLIGFGLPLTVTFVWQAIVFWVRIAPLVEKLGEAK